MHSFSPLHASPLHHFFLTFSLWNLISSDVTELWKPWAEVLQMLCHHAKHGRKQMPRQLSGATWEISDDALPRHCLCDFRLYLSFQLCWQTALCLPCSAGLVLMLARENVLVGKSWQGNRSRNTSTSCRGGKFMVQTIHTSKHSTLVKQALCLFWVKEYKASTNKIYYCSRKQQTFYVWLSSF